LRNIEWVYVEMDEHHVNLKAPKIVPALMDFTKVSKIFNIDLPLAQNLVRYRPINPVQAIVASTHVVSLSLDPRIIRYDVRPHLSSLLRLETSNNITAVGGKFPELRELFLHENIYGMESHIIYKILYTSPKLQYLTLSEWGHLTSFYSEHLIRILNAAPSIEVLRLYPRDRPWEQNEDDIFSLIARLTLRPVITLNNHTPRAFPCLPRLTHLLLHLPKRLAYSVRQYSGTEMESEIRSHASKLAVSPDFGNSRLRRIWIQDADCSPATSKLEKINKKEIGDHGVEVCIARPLVPEIGWEVGLVVLSSSGEITSALTNYT